MSVVANRVYLYLGSYLVESLKKMRNIVVLYLLGVMEVLFYMLLFSQGIIQMNHDTFYFCFLLLILPTGKPSDPGLNKWKCRCTSFQRNHRYPLANCSQSCHCHSGILVTFCWCEDNEFFVYKFLPLPLYGMDALLQKLPGSQNSFKFTKVTSFNKFQFIFTEGRIQV